MPDLTKLIASIGLGTALVPFAAISDADVGQIRWQTEAGNKLELIGSDFGRGPKVQLFDTFGTDGDDDRPMIVDSPRWFDRDMVRFDTEHALLGGRSSVVADTATDFRNVMVFQPEGNDTPHGTESFQEIYFSYAVKDVGSFPGTGGTETTFADRSSAKDAWLMLGRKGSGGYRIDDPWVGNDTVVPTHVSGTFKVDGNSGGPGLWRADIADNWAFQDWNQFFFHGVIDAANSNAGLSGMFGYVNENASRFDEIEGPLVSGYTKDQDLEPKKRYWDRLKFGSWYHLGNGGVHRVHDAIYIATGSNASARVMVGNSRYLNRVTRLHHGLPSSWTDTSVVVDLSHIDIESGKDWYVFATNGNSRLPSEGKPLDTASTEESRNEEDLSGQDGGSINESNLADFIGVEVELDMADGRTFVGRIKSANADSVTLSIDLDGGSIGYNVDRSDIGEATATQ